MELLLIGAVLCFYVDYRLLIVLGIGGLIIALGGLPLMIVLVVLFMMTL